MKKFTISFICAALLATTAWAKCDGGKTMNYSDHQYCYSDTKMTWWSAFSWCKANGRELVKWNDLCPGCTHNSTRYISPLSESSFYWTADPAGDQYAYILYYQGSSNWNTITRSRNDTSYKAVCY